MCVHPCVGDVQQFIMRGLVPLLRTKEVLSFSLLFVRLFVL